MVTLRTAALALVLGSTGCGDSSESGGTLERLEFAEHCGVAGPVRVLELMPGQVMTEPPTVLGERVYYNIGRPKGAPRGLRYERFTDRSLWSTGPCGESPTHLADGVGPPFVVERWPDLVFACHEDRGDIVLLHADGGAPTVVFADVDCGLAWTDEGLFGVSREDRGEAMGEEASIAALHFHPYPEDPREGGAAPLVLVDAIALPRDPFRGVYTNEDAIHVVTPTGELLRVDRADRSITVEQTGVRDFDISDDGRYVVWRGLTVTGGTPEDPLGVVSLADRAAGFSVSLGQSHSPVNPYGLRWADRGWFVYWSPYREAVYSLSELSFVPVPNSLDYGWGPLDDDRWVIYSSYPSRYKPWLEMLDLVEGSTTVLFYDQGQIVERTAEGVYVVNAPTCCIDDSNGRGEGSLWYVSYDGSEPRRVSSRATALAYRPDPTRLVTALAIDSSNRGALALVDLETDELRHIDDHVFLQRTTLLPGSDRELLTYSVIDGERSGVWLARLPPAP